MQSPEQRKTRHGIGDIIVTAGFALLLCVGALPVAWGQSYPVKSVRVIVPFPGPKRCRGQPTRSQRQHRNGTGRASRP